MSIIINNNHWLVADWIMRNLFKDILLEIDNSYEQHKALKEKIENSIMLHTYFLEFNNQTELQLIADLGLLIKRVEKQKLDKRGKTEIVSEGEITYANKISELIIIIESNFKSSKSHHIFDSERLEIEYNKSIWLYLEKITYYLIYLNKELKPNQIKSELTEIENYEPDFKIQYFSIAAELVNSKLFHSLINIIPRNEKLISAIIFLGEDQNSGIVNYRNHKMISGSNKLSDFHRVFKIRQEWGGSYWKVRYIETETQNEFNAMIYEEINNFKMEFTFKLN